MRGNRREQRITMKGQVRGCKFLTSEENLTKKESKGLKGQRDIWEGVFQTLKWKQVWHALRVTRSPVWLEWHEWGERAGHESREQARPLKELRISTEAMEQRNDLIWLTYWKLPLAAVLYKALLGTRTEAERPVRKLLKWPRLKDDGDLTLKVVVEMIEVVASVCIKLWRYREQNFIKVSSSLINERELEHELQC